MPPQHVEIAETVAALRRKLRREREATQSQPEQFATNRGNKLKPGARYVHAGSLPYRHVRGYKEKVQHAGYSRYILERNPKRYNEYGDELEDSESDAEADADAEEENAYGEVRIEELLRPLTHPSELASHPTMSIPYLDSALPDMVLATDAKIREERNNLWRAKNLYRYFTGDESWIPCERVEGSEDWGMFEPNPGLGSAGARLPSGESPGKKRRLNEDVDVENIDGDVQVVDAVDEDYGHANQEIVNGTLDGLQNPSQDLDVDGAGQQGTEKDRRVTQQEGEDIAMDEAIETSQPQTNGVHKVERPETTGHHPTADGQGRDGVAAKGSSTELKPEAADTERPPISPTLNSQTVDHENEEGEEEEEDRPSTASTPPLPTRRITRALAAETESTTNNQIVSPPPTSPTLSSAPPSPSSFSPHPLFLLPAHLSASHAPHPSYPPLTFSLAHSGLPPEELLETRKLLSLYIQKSEETIRGLEGILGKLIKSKRRREKLWEWCVAEGHVGEMSDGEDWVDGERWGLSSGELRKGRDEDSGNMDAVTAGAAAGGEAGPDENTGVVMGGRKGKRRRGQARD